VCVDIKFPSKSITNMLELISPNDETWFNDSSLFLIYNATDLNDDIVNTTLIINGQVNQTNSSAILNGQYNNYSTNFSDGQYNWTVQARDSQNNFGYGDVRSFYIDLQNPNITLVYPSKNSSYAASELNLSFNVTDNLDSSLDCEVVLDGSTIDTVSALNGQFTNVSSGSLSGGTHYWNVTCLDESGRSDTSETWNFTVSDEPPQVILISPEENYLDADGNISFVFNASDDYGFINCSLYLDGIFNKTNETAIQLNQNNTINISGISEGNHNWTIECIDFSHSSDKPNERFFDIDLYYPSIELNAPSDQSILDSSDVSFNFSINDSFDSSLDCNLTIKTIVKDTFSATAGQLTNRPISDLTDGEKIWNVTCWDDAGHINTSSTWKFNISEPPIVYLNTSNESSYDIDYFNLEYTPIDNTNLSSCDLYLDGIFNQSNSSEIINGELDDFSLTGVKDGTHTWFVNCTDTLGLSSISEIRTIYVDHNPPSIILYNFINSKITY
jgi:hypothetical protein